MSDSVSKLINTNNQTMLSPWTVDETANGFFILLISGLLVMFFFLEKKYNVEGGGDFLSILSYLILGGFIWIFLILNKKMKIARAFESDGINIDGLVVEKSLGYIDYEGDFYSKVNLVYIFNFEGDSYKGKITANISIFKDHQVGDMLTIRFLPYYPCVSRPILTF